MSDHAEDDLVPQLAANVVKFGQRLEQQSTAIRVGLTAWLDSDTYGADGVAVSLALMGTAIDKYLVVSDEDYAFDLMQLAFHRAVKRRRGPLQ
jgi:hypothetical protein